MVGKVKNGVARPLCHGFAGGDVISDDSDRVTCRRCLEHVRADRYAEDLWYRNQSDHYGETL